MTFTAGRGYDRVYWLNWVNKLTKVEEEYATGQFAVTTYQYDETGHLTAFTDAENHTTAYMYASQFGLTEVTYPNAEYEEYTYDSVGNIISLTDCKRNETSYMYDELCRLTDIQYADQTDISFSYDLDSNRIMMIDNAPNTGDYIEYAYDQWDRMISKTRHISQDALAVSLEYDVSNRLTKLTYPNNMQILYSYDDFNRMTEVRRYVDGTNDEILLENVQYDAEGLVTQFDYGNGIRSTFSYDSRDRISAVDARDGETFYLDLDYSYDNNSNIVQLGNRWKDTNSTWHSDTESYDYDGIDRLTSASCASWSHTYAYDKAGNRTSRDGTTYTINVVNEVMALSDGTSFTYDANGNRTQKTKGDDTWDYQYNCADKLVKVRKNGIVLEEYVYDGDGRRIQVTENSETETYMYFGSHVLYEENPTGDAVYVFGPLDKIAKRTAVEGETHTFYYHVDHLGSTRLITDENENVVESATFHPFGEEQQEGSEEFLFAGKEKDSTGLYYYGARYYDPETGQFISRDLNSGSLINPQSLNRYSYVLNNPSKYRDPDGCEQAGALMGNEGSGYPSLNSLGGPVSWSWAPQKIGEVSPGNPLCLVAMMTFCAIGVSGISGVGAIAKIATWLKGYVSKITAEKIVDWIVGGLVGTIIAIGLSKLWIVIWKGDDDKKYVTVTYERESGEYGQYVMDDETGEILKGERWIDGVHQVWVHVPGEGDFGGHWEDDLDGDGIVASVDDDDANSEVGDEDPDVP
ncbi:MAG: RHS repeat protein [Theionarchaea archaeon]|nr:RHS repeat protein [Theionarchaea archaeon]